MEPNGEASFDGNAAVNVSVGVDSTPPQLTVNPIGDNGKVYLIGPSIIVPVSGTASDAQSGVSWVEYMVDGANPVRATPSPSWSNWTANLQIPLGTHTVTVRAADNVGNIATTQPIPIEAVDNTAPTVVIQEPPDYFTKLGDETGAKITVSGTATDLQSGVAAVEWALDNSSQYKQAITQTNWAAWSAEVQVPPDFHLIKVRARDNKNNVSVPGEKPVRVSLSFKPGDQEDNVSQLAYLRDLIEFARAHVTVALPGGGTRALWLRDLTRQFFQPFGDLTSGEQVRQLRICIEVLRDYLDPRPAAHWNFDESGGPAILDSSGNGNTGTLQGPTRTVGKVGGALQFDGVDDVVRLDSASFGDPINNFTVAFWTNPRATHEIDAQSTSGTGGTSGQKYAIDLPQGGTLYGSLEHACAGVSVGTNGISVYEHSDSYMPALLVYQVAISGWTHVVLVYENKQPRLYLNGILVKTGLASPKKFVHLNPQTLGGMGYGFFNGQLDDVRIYGRALSEVEVRDLFSPLPAGEVVWVDDAVPTGAATQAEGGDAWNWVSTNPAPFSGTKAHQSNLFAGVHQHFFVGATTPLAVKRGDKFFAYVYLDPSNVPEEVMLQWNDGTWEHRAYWGADKITWWGTAGTNSRRHMGPLPSAGQWVRLEVTASQVGLSNRMVSGMAFTLYGGRATWDRSGKIGYKVGLEAAESCYRQTVYQALLSNLGTSYEELRLVRHQAGEDENVRKALEKTREALASRLGIDYDTSRANRLDKLLLQPDQITEAAFETLFGLADTTRDPLSARPAPDLLTWRLEHLRTLWLEQDHPADPGGDSSPPLIDPDLVRQEDLIVPTSGRPNPAFALWQTRSEWVNGISSRLANDRKAGETDKDRLERLIGATPSSATEKLSMAAMLALEAERQQGKVIHAELQKWQLSIGAFSYLIRMHNVAVAGSLLDSEWSDVYSILVQVEKLHKYKDWRTEEVNLTLSTDYFILPSTEATVTTPSSPKFPAWRATARERRLWQNKLRARADQELAVAQGLQSAVDAAEEATLPLLRDALVEAAGATATGESRSNADVSNWLTDWLLIEVKGTGRQKTTRINQAIETLQSILFSLRTNRFKDVNAEAELEPFSPRPDWNLAVSTSDFDQEWAWMGSYATWRAAMLVFLYPENLLLPSLRGELTQDFKIEQRSGSFKTMVENLRGQQSLTPDAARGQANEYLTRLRTGPLTGVLPAELNAPFEITEQLNETQLRALAKQGSDLFIKYAAPDKKSELFYVTEVFYFVPIQIALQLQKSRQYTAALDWFQTVYAYNLPVEQRKIYYGLVLESSIQSSYERVLTTWLLGDLNPHVIATKRKDAYTRFTLLAMVRCFLDFADSEFTNDTGESISRARTLYLSALDLLDLPELQTPKDFGFAPNPVVQALRLHAELNLFKLRDNRNIAGMQRQTEVPLPTRMINSLPTIGGGGQLTLPGAQTLHPTPYRYSVLMERAKHLVALAQQIEAAYFSTLERTSAEGYTELKARQDLELTKASVDLQNLRVTEATGGVELARLQQERSEAQGEYYSGLITEGISSLEIASLAQYGVAARLQLASAAVSFSSAFLPASISVGFPSGVSASVSPQGSAGAIASSLSSTAAALSTTASITATLASYERRAQEWQFQRTLAQKDVAIGAQQITSARDRVSVVNQELNIARTQDVNANAAVDFLTTGRFATAELYEWMSGILGRVYDYFLQQATATARLAQSQLAFERQEGVLSIVQSDYWQPPSEGGTMPNGSSDGQAPDRQGITGSARLLQDIYQLDQYAFETDKRKLQLTKTISLVRAAPLEFQRFRETGTLPFATPMEMFDRDFPGHYLRLIKRVRTSVVALVPSTQGIRATLATTGVSRVTTSGNGIFQTVPISRDLELVALSLPNNASGLFELDQQSDMLLPFEAMGVDTSWELQMPKAANPFDYRTIADVLFTIEYTALNSFDYRQQVVQELDHAISADYPVSLRQQFPDQWYDLHNPDQATPPAMTIRFDITREDLPPNLDDLRTQHLSLYMLQFDGQPIAIPLTVSLYFTPQNGTETGGGASSNDGVFSTRRGNANEWLNKICNQVPQGTWRLALPNTQEVKDLFNNEEIEDILLVITYSGSTPEWPI